ncbi:hypothetical protein [Dictyobacter arantiisoli]|uniref:Uncharacterized protein n=1 Tax=Dictyobacter arantiisoli TaxID=2014874 RepID=A0A5A5T9L8_9CHLR|nr:hypothetical protein [Dictyobacter arantiisoli]GCF07955.1 hypothetical protein KDI_15190 [Dictyobacter arantiisoli]
MKQGAFQRGSKVRVINYSPFRCLTGIVQEIDKSADIEVSLYFYCIQLDGVNNQGPMWFQHEELELVGLNTNTR